MLKCPRCGARIKGPDLLTGVCSACQQRLSASLSGLDSFHDGDRTFVSEDDLQESASPEGSSLDGSFSGSVHESSAAESGEGLAGSFDLGLTPPVGADGVNDHDTDEGESRGGINPLSESVAADDNLRTFVSDQWSDDDQGSVRESESLTSSPLGDDALKTIASDQWDADDVSGGDEDGDAGKTYVSDELPLGGVEANFRTLVSDLPDEAGGDDAVDDRADRTLVLDDDQNSPRVPAGGMTMQVNPSGGLEASSPDRTFVSEEVPEALLRTLQSNFDDEEDAPPGRTLKGRDQERLKSPKSTLVIKTRLLRDMKMTRSTAGSGDQDPEYELLKILGEGGMGVVYDARQTSIDRQVALKMIKGAAAKSDKQQAKFLAEAVVTGDLDHPNIVPIYDVGRNEAGALFYSMKKVQGTPWDEVLLEKTQSENIEILMRVADAVAFAHARGVVHRDLKPENTMLGEFGEVLVMDWGLAQPSKRFRKSSSITETSSMGGTPAYMAPEMATGPLEKISHLSDVYLLGAMLYEVLTGKPPHSGKNAMKCLMAAARNEIVPTDKTGELLDIALKALATNPDDRYPSVQAFQAAIREYQSHSESILLSTRADDDLEAARSSDVYQTYAKALFGYQEAYALWSGNVKARSGVAQAQFAYAESARRKGDFDLGLSLLSPDHPVHQPLIARLTEEKRERESRQQRLAALRKMFTGLAVAMFATVTVAFVWISYEADNARRAERTALAEKQAADAARLQAEAAEVKAVASRDLATLKQMEAEQAQIEEARARQDAVAARDLAEEKRRDAEEARKLEEIAKRKEEYEAYIAEIGLAAARIDENAFESARQILEDCSPHLRNWEWGRLMHLCSQSESSIPSKAPLESLALVPDRPLCVTGGWDGTARLWNFETGELIREFPHGGIYVHAVAVSPDGQWLVTGSDDPAGYVQLWNLTSGQRERILKGHSDSVLSVAFRQDGQEVLTSSYDNTARRWNWQTGEETQVLRGHTWWVWQAVYSPDQSRIVTVGQDGIALVWDAKSGERSPPFTGHRGPVYCAAFVRDGSRIVTGGYDRRLLEWSPADLKAPEFRNLEQGDAVTAAPKYRDLGAHATSVRSVAVNAEGNLLLSGGQDNTLRLWDLNSRQNLQTFRGHDSWVRGVAFGPDGHLLVSASQDATLRTWSLAGYEELRSFFARQLDGHSDAILSASFSPDQKQIVTASRDRTARTWNVFTGETQQTFEEGHAFLASAARFFENGRKLVTAAVDNSCRVWDVASGTEILRLERTGRAAAIAISADGKWIATGGDARNAQVWDSLTGELLQTFPDHVAEVTAVAFSPDGAWLLTGDAKGHGRLWNVADGQLIRKLDGHTGRITAAAFIDQGRQLLMASNDKTVSRWNAVTGQELTTAILKHPDSVLALAVLPDENSVVTSCSDRRIRLWSLENAQLVSTIGPLGESVHAISISQDGLRCLTAHAEERVVRQWDLRTGTELLTPQANGPLGPVINLKRSGGLVWAALYAPGDDILTVGGNDARLWNSKTGRERMAFSPHATIASANFSPDGRWVVTGSWDNSAKIWNVETGAAALKLTGHHRGFVNSAVFAPDGQHVVTASDDGTAKLWKIVFPLNGSPASATVVRSFDGHADRVRSAILNPSGDILATTSDDKTVRLWKTATGELLRTLNGHDWAILTAAFSQDGQRLVTGSEDNSAKIWNVGTGECELTVMGHTAPVASVAFAPDGARVLTGSRDQTAKIWDALTGKEILTLVRHSDDVTSVSFSPDGQQVLTASRDGSAIIWPAERWKPAVPEPDKAVNAGVTVPAVAR